MKASEVERLPHFDRHCPCGCTWQELLVCGEPTGELVLVEVDDCPLHGRLASGMILTLAEATEIRHPGQHAVPLRRTDV